MTRQTRSQGLSQTDLLFIQHRGLTPAEFDALAVPGQLTRLRCRICARIAQALLAASRWFDARSRQTVASP